MVTSTAAPQAAPHPHHHVVNEVWKWLAVSAVSVIVTAFLTASMSMFSFNALAETINDHLDPNAGGHPLLELRITQQEEDISRILTIVEGMDRKFDEHILTHQSGGN